jgi:hypothetical protein
MRATVAGNVEVGIYNYESMAKIVSSTAAAQSGISTIQTATVTTTTILPGVYLFALMSTSATATFLRVTPSAVIQQAVGCGEMNTASPLPATLTYTAPSSTQMPIMFALTAGTSVL